MKYARHSILMLFASAVLASADPLYMAGVQVTGVNNTSVQVEGRYGSPYIMNIQPTGGAISTIKAYCDDFADQITLGQAWSANVFSGSNLGGAYYASDPNYMQKYGQMFWLVGQMDNTTNTGDLAAMQEALWNVEDPSLPMSIAGQGWAAQAQANYGSVNYNSFQVVDGVSNSDTNRPQEFVIVASATPEPSTWMMGIMGIGFVWAGKRRLRKN